MKFRALDLFCGAGGVATGLVQAGYVVDGVDIADLRQARGSAADRRPLKNWKPRSAGRC